MKQKTVMISILIGIFLILVGFSPLTISEQSFTNQHIFIQSTIFDNGIANKKTSELSLEDTIQLKEILLELNNAIDQNDQETIQNCVIQLKHFGIVDDVEKLKLFTEIRTEPTQTLNDFNKFPVLKSICEKIPTYDVDNSMCLVNIIGKGLMLFTTGLLLIITTILLAYLFGDAISPILLTFFNLSKFFLLVTRTIPFRVLLPVGIIMLDSGSISTRGLNGHQQLNATDRSVGAYLYGFSGIAINIPFSQNGSFTYDSFIFVAGFSILARAVDT